MPPAGFETTISADEWPQTYALERAATGTGHSKDYNNNNNNNNNKLQLGCHPVAVVILHLYKIRNWLSLPLHSAFRRVT